MRVRLRYTKLGKVRFLSHRDLARVWERALRRAGLPVARTEGFSPRPRLHFGLALPVGHESVAEYLDVDLRDEPGGVDVAGLPAQLDPCLPEGVAVTGAIVVDDHATALQAAVTSVTWWLEVEAPGPDQLERRLGALLDCSSRPMEVQRKGRAVEIDARPIVLAAEVVRTSRGCGLRAELATVGRSLRPAELLAAFEPPITAARVRREEQWMDIDGVRRPPVPADPSRSPALVAG